MSLTAERELNASSPLRPGDLAGLRIGRRLLLGDASSVGFLQKILPIRVFGYQMADKKNRRLLTDRFLRSLPPAPRGPRVEVFDARLPCFGIRISDAKDADPARRGKAGKITFILYARFAPGAAPARRTIGVYGADAMRLEDARRIAGEWRSQIARGTSSNSCGSDKMALKPFETSFPGSILLLKIAK